MGLISFHLYPQDQGANMHQDKQEVLKIELIIA